MAKMHITSDWHIHSRNSCDESCMSIEMLVVQAKKKGIHEFGLTDHLHTSYNLPNINASRKEFLASKPSPHFHFGVEVSCVSQWELNEIATGKYERPVYGVREGGPAGAELAIALTAEDIPKYGIEYVIGGIHWPMYVPLEREAVIRDYHRQNMFLATHPLVDIIAHPWWWMGYWQDHDDVYRTEPWFDDFKKIPNSMHEEFVVAILGNNKVVEINIEGMLLNPHYPEKFKWAYLSYLSMLRECGVKLSIGSDCHNANYEIDFGKASAMLDIIGIKDEELWSLAKT